MPARSYEWIVGEAENRLQYCRGYLCGAMDRVADGGEGWRVELQKALVDLNIFWLDPTHKPIDIGIEDVKVREEITRYKSDGDYEKASLPVRIIRAVDLRMVDISDFLVVNIDLDTHAAGTYEELFLANRQKKPVIVRVAQGKQHTPNWLLATLPHQMIFSFWDEVEDYLRKVATSPVIRHYNRWMFFDFSLCRKFS